MSAPRPGAGLRLLADDLTGALDSAAAFGAGVPVHLEQPPAAGAPAAAVVAVSTATRDVPPHTLPARLAGVLPWFSGGALAFKKVDSLLRGNTFAECAHLLQAGGFDGLVFAPAFPAQRRVTAGGRHRAAGEPVGSIVEAFGALGLPCHVGPAAQALADGPAARVRVPDIAHDADLRVLARHALAPPAGRRWLWAGSAGLAHAIAAEQGGGLAADGTGLPLPAPAVAPAGARSVLLLGASHHAVVRAQWARLRAARPQVLAVCQGDARQFDAACHALAQGCDLAGLELSPPGPLTPAAAAALLQAQLATLVARALRPAAVLVIGGDTLLGLCRATGAASLCTRPARRPGWGCARLLGGVWDGVECHSRSGAFGDADDLVEMLAAVAGR